MASLIGDAESHALLQQVYDESEETVARAIDVLYRSKLLIPVGELSSRFPNGVIRAVVEQDIGSASRTLLRRRIERARSDVTSVSG